VTRALALAASLLLGASASGCDPSERLPARSAKAPPCPPPPEPTYQAAVVGTIGKLHLVESGYPIARLGDVLAAYKPDLVLVAVRVDAFREARFEEASFEMTYVTSLARQRGVFVEPIDWFRDEELGAPLPAVEPWDAAEIARRDAELLTLPRLYTFAQANSEGLLQQVLRATGAEARYRGGSPVAARRRAWMQELIASAVTRHGRPKRVLAYVDVLDRPGADGALHALGYATQEPAAIVGKSKDELIADLSSDVLADWRGQKDRAGHRLLAAKTKGERAFWADQRRALEVVTDRRAACCVTQATLAPPIAEADAAPQPAPP
jgi:hypothetical protein